MGPKAAADALALVQLGAGASTGRARRIVDISETRLDAILSKTKDFGEDLCLLVEPVDAFLASKKKRAYHVLRNPEEEAGKEE